MTAKYTPWRAVNRGHGYAVESEAGLTIAWVGKGGLYGDSVQTQEIGDCKRHAQLMAAAPELYDALEQIADQLERIGDTRPHKDGQFIEAAREALALARGES